MVPMEIESVFANAFRSERLIYRQMQKNDSDKDFVSSFYFDPVSRGLAGGLMLHDKDTKSRREDVETMITHAMLAVVICLPPEKEPEEAEQSDGMERRRVESERSTPIGWLRLSKTKEDYPRRFTALGINIHERYQNKGYGSESVNWALDWAFNFAGAYKVELTTASYNHRALHLYEKLGFKEEGRRRHHCFMGGKPYDMVEFGMLEEEYWELRGKK